jgi:hypothetical protein
VSGKLLQLAGSLAAVLFLIAVAWKLRLGGEAKIADEADARELADNASCGFDAAAVAIDREGHGALLRDSAGQIMLLAPHGNRFIGRLLDGRASARLDGERLTIATGERRVASVSLDLPDAAAWCRTIEALD